jgi:hypothetical protein
LGNNHGSARVEGLALTTSVDSRTNRPVGSAVTTFRGDEEAIYLCLNYHGMRRGEEVLVQWFQEVLPDEPMAVSNVRVGSDEGNLAASFLPDGSLPAGDYRAVVRVRGQEAGSLSFTVAR